MVSIIRHFPANGSNGSDRTPPFEKKRPLYSIAAEDTFDDLLALLDGLTDRQDDASPDMAAPDVAADNVAAGNVAAGNVEAGNVEAGNVAPKEPARPRLPSVDEFDFEEASAKSMASKFAPQLRYSGPYRARRNFPHGQNKHDDERNADWRDSPQASAAPRGGARGLFWSFCTSILIVFGMPAAFGLIQPLNDLLPQRMGDFLSDLSQDVSASLINSADTPTGFKVTGANAASGPPPVSPDQTMAPAAVVVHPVPTTSIRVDVQPSANSGGSGIVFEQAEPPGATNEKAIELGAKLPEPGKIDSAEFAKSKSAATLALAPVAAPAPPAPAPAPPAPAAVAPAPAATPLAAAPTVRAPDQGNKYASRKPALQRSVKVDPSQITNTAQTVTQEQGTSAPRPVTSTLTAAQIDRLMARGEKLLQSGDIASARLLFQRVAAAGDRRGAKGVGMTYDPDVYARLPVTGLTPDREQAEIWYRKAGVDSASTTDLNSLAGKRKSQEPRSPEWNTACAQKYNSFEPSTGLFTANSGAKRPCKLP